MIRNKHIAMVESTLHTLLLLLRLFLNQRCSMHSFAKIITSVIRAWSIVCSFVLLLNTFKISFHIKNELEICRLTKKLLKNSGMFRDHLGPHESAY